MSFRDGFVVFTQSTGTEFSVPIWHIVKVAFTATTNITTLYFIDGSSETFTTSTDEFYQRAKKEMYTWHITDRC